MPSKSKKVASKQVSLKKKKRREKGAGQIFDSGPTEAQIRERDERASEVKSSSTSVSDKSSYSQPKRKAASRHESDGTPLPYPYLGSEIRRIAIMSTGILIILGTTTFIIGS